MNELKELRQTVKDLQARLSRTPGGYRPPRLPDPLPRTRSAAERAQDRPAAKPKPAPRFKPAPDVRGEALRERRRAAATDKINAVVADNSRNDAIVKDLVELHRAHGKVVVVVSALTAHCLCLQGRLHKACPALESAYFGAGGGQGKLDVLFATGDQFPDLDPDLKVACVYLASPIQSRIGFLTKIAQLMLPRTDCKTMLLAGRSDQQLDIDRLVDSVIERHRDFYKVGNLRHLRNVVVLDPAG